MRTSAVFEQFMAKKALPREYRLPFLQTYNQGGPTRGLHGLPGFFSAQKQ